MLKLDILPDYIRDMILNASSTNDVDEVFERLLCVSATLVLNYYRKISLTNDALDAIINYLDNGHYDLNLGRSKEIINQAHGVYAREGTVTCLSDLSSEYFKALLCGNVSYRMLINKNNVLERCCVEFTEHFEFIFSNLPKSFEDGQFEPWFIKKGNQLYRFIKTEKKSKHVYEDVSGDIIEIEKEGRASLRLVKRIEKKQYDAFISYRRNKKDKPEGEGAASWISRTLKGLGKIAFFDLDSMEKGQFPPQIEGAIKASENFILVLSGNMFSSETAHKDWVVREVELAMHHLGLDKIIVVTLNNYDTYTRYPKQIKSIKGCQQFNLAQDDDDDMQRIIAQIK